MKKPKPKNIALGAYDHEWNSYATVDPSVKHELGEDSTILHEMVHMRLTQSTSYGFLVHLLMRLGKFDSKLTKTAYHLQSNMLKLQEGLAVFYEMILFYEKNGKESCVSYLDNMKYTNIRYYNFVKPLEFLIHDHDNLTLDEKLEMAQALCLYALSSDLKRMSPFLLKPRLLENEFKKTASNYALEVIPDVRFERLIETLKELIEQNRSVTGQLALEESGVKTFNYTVEDVIELLTGVIQDHEQKQNMIAQLNSNNLRAIDPDELYLLVHPTSLKSYHPAPAIIGDMERILQKGNGTVYLGKLLTVPSLPQQYTVIFMDFATKTNYLFSSDKKSFMQLLSKTRLPLTLTPSVYEKLTHQDAHDPFLSIVKRPVYIYVDAPYISSKERINSYLTDHAACIIIPFEEKELSLLVIKPNVNDEVFILQLMFSHQENYIIDHIEGGGLRAKLLINDEDNIQNDFFNSGDQHYFSDYEQIITAVIQEGGSGELNTDMYRQIIQQHGSLEDFVSEKWTKEMNKLSHKKE